MAEIVLLNDANGVQEFPVTKAEAVYFEDGQNAEEMIPSTIAQLRADMQELEDNLRQDFLDGCNTIYNGAVAVGVTPKSKTPTDLAAAYRTAFDLGNWVVLKLGTFSSLNQNVVSVPDTVPTKSKLTQGNFFTVPVAITEVRGDRSKNNNYHTMSITYSSGSVTLTPCYVGKEEQQLDSNGNSYNQIVASGFTYDLYCIHPKHIIE